MKLISWLLTPSSLLKNPENRPKSPGFLPRKGTFFNRLLAKPRRLTLSLRGNVTPYQVCHSSAGAGHPQVRSIAVWQGRQGRVGPGPAGAWHFFSHGWGGKRQER